MILVSQTNTKSIALGKLIIPESCSLCGIAQAHDKSCLRNKETNKIICKTCIKGLCLINLRAVVKDVDQLDIKF